MSSEADKADAAMLDCGQLHRKRIAIADHRSFQATLMMSSCETVGIYNCILFPAAAHSCMRVPRAIQYAGGLIE